MLHKTYEEKFVLVSTKNINLISSLFNFRILFKVLLLYLYLQNYINGNNGEEIISKKPSKPQASRKGKRAWRKNIDIQEIEQNLQDKRDEEIVLGKEVTDDFVIDDTPSSKSGKLPKKLKTKEILTNKSKIPALTNQRHQKGREHYSGVKN